MKTIDRIDQKAKHVTAFSAVKQEYGLKIEVIGCVELCPTRSTSENVIGIIELEDQIVPILDLRNKKTADIADLCCIVLLENLIGDTTIMTGCLYENSCQVFDLIIDYMDSPVPKDSTQEDSASSLSPSLLHTMPLE